MTAEETLDYYNKLTARVLAHRYRYYVLDHPVIADHEYDYLERFYSVFCNENGLENHIKDTVGWSREHYKAEYVAELVKTDLDDYSLWLKEMKPVWAKLGRSKKQKDTK